MDILDFIKKGCLSCFVLGILLFSAFIGYLNYIAPNYTNEEQLMFQKFYDEDKIHKICIKSYQYFNTREVRSININNQPKLGNFRLYFDQKDFIKNYENIDTAQYIAEVYNSNPKNILTYIAFLKNKSDENNGEEYCMGYIK